MKYNTLWVKLYLAFISLHNYISIDTVHVSVIVHPVRINCSALCLLGVLYCNLCKYFIYKYWHAWIVLPSMSGSAEQVVDRSGAQEYLLVIPVCPLPDRPLGHNAAWWCHLSPSVACSSNDPPSTSSQERDLVDPEHRLWARAFKSPRWSCRLWGHVEALNGICVMVATIGIVDSLSWEWSKFNSRTVETQKKEIYPKS